MHYYEVGIGSDKHWGKSVYTYSSKDKLTKGQLVRVKFGNKNKNGLILSMVSRPSFETKQISLTYSGVTIDSNNMLFMDWYRKYYSARDSQVYSQFVPQYLTENKNSSTEQFKPSVPKVGDNSLNKLQSEVFNKIMKQSGSSIIHGITGSGKTRIYIQTIIKFIEDNKSALLLYPEISLTSQLIDEIVKSISTVPVYIFHSGVSDSERSRIWQVIARSESNYVVIGPRSTLFLPHKNLGLIIVDEMHEQSYKQETGVRYNALHVASGLSNSFGAKLIFGSATPPLNETEYITKDNGDRLICIHEKAKVNDEKLNINRNVKIIDIKDRRLFKIHNLLSDHLIHELRMCLNRGEQALIFINRRGTAKAVLCENITCDWQAICNKCDLPLTFHHDKHILLCHTCGNKRSMPLSCEKCRGRIILKSLGTKALYEDISKIFPEAKIGRFDSDTNDESSFLAKYNDIKSGKIDILIGTQQLVNGLDLPKLSTICIVNADLSLNFPDYTSDEKTFQLICQSLGRVGRGHSYANANIVIQTAQPKSKIIHEALEENWHSFRERELLSRKLHHFPPYYFYAKVIIRAKTEKTALNQCSDVAQNLINISGKEKLDLKVDGPVQSFYSKRGNYFYYQVIICSKKRNTLLSVLDDYSDKYIIDMDPQTLL